MSEIKSAKSKLRIKMTGIRSSMLRNDREVKSIEIVDNINIMREFIEAAKVLCYISFRDEVNTTGLINKMLKMGKEVYVPRVVSDRNSDENAAKYMEAVRIMSFDDVKPGYKGIFEPEKSMKASAVDFDLIFIPGLAFGIGGERLGYGGGYFDKFLLTHTSSYKAALSFDVQIAEEIPHDENDVFMDTVITESKVYKINKL